MNRYIVVNIDKQGVALYYVDANTIDEAVALFHNGSWTSFKYCESNEIYGNGCFAIPYTMGNLAMVLNNFMQK